MSAGQYAIRLAKSIAFGLIRGRRGYRAVGISCRELSKLYRFTQLHNKCRTIKTTLFGQPLEAFNDYFWYLHSINELYIDEIYKCKISNPRPIILDCGANIGLSVIYFKRLFPNAEITAFEPDTVLAGNIAYNVRVRKLDGVTIVNKAVWSATKTLHFTPEGHLGGAIAGNIHEPSGEGYRVEAIRLRDYLNRRIDFLKIDIEGAEYEVMADCRDLLCNVEYLFFEWHGLGTEPQRLHEVLTWVQQAGFRYHIKDAWENQKQPLLERRTLGRDLQLNIFCYRT